MFTFIFALLLVLFALLALALEKTFFYVPKKELKRQAAKGDQMATNFYQAAAYGDELKLLLWIIMGLSAAAGIVLFSRVAPSLLGIVAVTIVIWLGFVWLPRTRLTLIGARIAEWCVPTIVTVLRVLHPVLRRTALYVNRHHVGPHTGLYEREDMEELLERQRLQSDNRISDEEMERMNRLLQFGHLQVGDVIIPQQKVIAVDVNDAISPIMLDEMHKSGHPRFPVFEGDETTVVGTLALDIVADTKHGGKVRDYYDPHLAFVHVSDDLEQALKTFSEIHQHMFIVINGADEYIGIITLSDILHHLLGEVGHEKFGRYDDRKAVVERHRQHTMPKEAGNTGSGCSPETATAAGRSIDRSVACRRCIVATVRS